MKKNREQIIEQFPALKLGDQGSLALLLREIACQLADLNETMRGVAEWQHAIAKKLDEIKDQQGGGQGSW